MSFIRLTAAAAPRTPRASDSHRRRADVVERWVARRLGSIDHERRVADIAATLFDLTAGLLDLAAADRRLLRLASLVHDVGRCAGEADHPADGAAMLLADAALPVSAAERRALAYLTLYHRGRVPDAEAAGDVLLRTDDHARLRRVLALLRAADGLDSRSLESPRLVFALVGAGPSRRLRVTCHLVTDCAKARRVYRRRKKFRLLEELMNCRVEIDMAHAQALRMVA